MFLPILGRYHVLTMSWCQSFLEVPSQYPRAEIRSGHITIQAAQPQWTHRKAPGISCLFVWLAGLPGGLDWPVSLSPPQVKVCFLSRARACLSSGVVCRQLTCEMRLQVELHPTQPWGRILHSSWACLTACYSPLWTTILQLPGPIFRTCLSFNQSACLLPIIMVNSLQSPLLKEHWRYQCDPGMDDPMHDPGHQH